MKTLPVAILPLVLSIACGEKPRAAKAAMKAPVDSVSQLGAAPSIAAVVQPAAASPVEPPGTLTPDLVEACDTAESVMRRVLGVTPKRENGAYKDSFRGANRVGCRLSATVVEAIPQEAPPPNQPPAPGIEERMQERGWAQDYRLSADGPDGGTLALRRRDLLCVVSHQGPHDDDEDTTSVRRSTADTVDYSVECARETSSNDGQDVPDSLWVVARAQGLDSLYAIDFRLQYPPYLTGDFDADGTGDAAVLVNERATGKLGLAFVLRGKQRVIVVGAGKPIGGRDDFAGVTGWEKFLRGFSMASGIPFIPTGPLAADGVWLQFRDSTSGFVEWNGASYTWDVGKRIK